VSAFGRMATNNFDKKFNYNRITDAPKPTDTLINDVYIERNQRGIITRISDGKSPLMLGSIPSQETNIQKLRDEFGLSDVAIIKVYTLNRPFERNWSGLAKLVKNNPKKLKAFTYVTTDSGPPAFIDLVKAVYDLEHRDATPHTLAYVHCKAGKGRSAVTVAAYLAHLGNKAGITLTPQEIKQFLVSKRPVVRFNDYHQKGLEQFCEELQKAGSLEALCTEYPEALL
ncbi:MAG: hypothetical protein NTX86_03310, partial [Candidatus Dependentiae bacterium]|nr:hypothetical protein [Candidatus Dependentiae bacterium]